MLYLRQWANSSREESAGRVPVAELTAVGLERALLAPDVESRCRELIVALTRDPSVNAWVIQSAERQLGWAPLTIDEAASWFACNMEQELASALIRLDDEAANSSAHSASIEIRLPAIARRLADYGRKLEAFDQRLARDKLDAMKELAYGASHEINNPLANIAARAQTLLQDENDPERRRKLAAIHRQAMRAHEMISDLMLFARPPKLEPATCDVGRLVRQVVDELRDFARERQAELACNVDEGTIQLTLDATQIAVAVHAVVINALEASGEGGHIEVGLRLTEVGGQSWAEIAVRDDGPGVSDEVRQHMFDPFFSGREAGRGLGFGLSKCWRIVTDHGGKVIVDRPDAGGAEVVILLPLGSRDRYAG